MGVSTAIVLRDLPPLPLGEGINPHQFDSHPMRWPPAVKWQNCQMPRANIPNHAIALLTEPGSTLSSVMTPLDMMRIARRHNPVDVAVFTEVAFLGKSKPLHGLFRVRVCWIDLGHDTVQLQGPSSDFSG
jgi:hypothetical protein